MMENLGFIVDLDTTYDEAVTKVTAALKTEGFGVLTEIDVKSTLKKKIDVDFHPYTILGACNPPLAHKALTAAPEVGLLLPCNVTVQTLENGRVRVSFINAQTMMQVIKDNPVLTEVANEVTERMSRVAQVLEA